LKKKSHKGAQRVKRCGSGGKTPAAELTRKPSENLNNETPSGGVALLGGVFLYFPGCFFVALSAALCGSLRGVLGVGGIVYTLEALKGVKRAFCGFLCRG